MNLKNNKSPGFIYCKNSELINNNIIKIHEMSNSTKLFQNQHQNPSSIYQTFNDDDIDEYFQTIKDSEQQFILPSKIPKHLQKNNKNVQSTASIPLTKEYYCTKKFQLPKNKIQLFKIKDIFERNQKQVSSYKNPLKQLKKQKIIMNDKLQISHQLNQNVKINCKKLQEIGHFDKLQDFVNDNKILNPQKQLIEPEVKCNYTEQPQKILQMQEVIQQKLQNITKKQQIVQQEPDVSINIIKYLFDIQNFKNKSTIKKNIDASNDQSMIQKIFDPFKLVEFTSPSISSSIPKFIKQLILLKELQNHISFSRKKQKAKQVKSKITQYSNDNNTSHILQKIKLVVKQIQQMQYYEGIDNLLTVNSKIQQIKRFLVFERLCIVIITYIVILGKFEEYKNYLINLIRFLIQNHVILLNNIISSKNLNYLMGHYYPHLHKKSFDFIKVNNDSINQIILKLSIIDDIFFSSLNKLAKKIATFSFGQIFKEFLSFLSFYLHKNNLQHKGYIFSTAPSPFLKVNHNKYYLVIDSTYFCIKDKKNIYSFRPFYQNFLRQMSQRYQIINYSNISPKQAKYLIQQFDKQSFIKHQLFSHHFFNWPHFHRCIQKVFLQPSNLIYLNCEQKQMYSQSISLKKWKGDKKDRQLVDILPVLISIPHLKLNCQKVTKYLQSCNGNIGKMQENLLLFLKQNNM